jgi:hypothetical protein
MENNKKLKKKFWVPGHPGGCPIVAVDRILVQKYVMLY